MSESIKIIITRPPSTQINVQTPAPAKVNVKGIAGPPGRDGASTPVSVVATEDISQYDVVTGNGKRATSDGVPYRNKLVGIAVNNIANGFSGQVQSGGGITNPGWSWTAGDRIYLNGYALSTIAPTTGFSVQIGIAAAADTVNIEIQPSILL